MKLCTRAVRNLLKHHFPETKFSVKLYPTYNYAISSDKIVVKCFDVSDDTIETVISILRTNVRGGIVVSRDKLMRSQSDIAEYAIFDPISNEWVDGDMVEFITVNGA